MLPQLVKVKEGGNMTLLMRMVGVRAEYVRWSILIVMDCSFDAFGGCKVPGRGRVTAWFGGGAKYGGSTFSSKNIWRISATVLKSGAFLLMEDIQ
jgi:hypothetical protein